MYVFVDLADVPFERAAFVFGLGVNVTVQFLTLELNIGILGLELLFENSSNFFQFLPIINTVVLEGG